MSDGRVAFAAIAFLLASCSSENSQVSRITGRWQSTAIGPEVNEIDLTLSQDGETLKGVCDVRDMTYDLNGRWLGSFGPNDIIRLDLAVTDTDGNVTGVGTLSTGGEDTNVNVVGSRSGGSFELSVNPANGEALRISGHLDRRLGHFLLSIEIENIPSSLQGGEHRDLQLTIEGRTRGGPLNLFPFSD